MQQYYMYIAVASQDMPYRNDFLRNVSTQLFFFIHATLWVAVARHNYCIYCDIVIFVMYIVIFVMYSQKAVTVTAFCRALYFTRLS